MPFNADATTLMLVALLVVLVVVILFKIVCEKGRERRVRQHNAAVAAVIVEYFHRSGVQVAVDCSRREGSRNFIAMVESEPMKRFRLSHIIEMTLREHVRKNCGFELEKIYWRFPIKEAAQPQVADGVPKADEPVEAKKVDEHADDYINEGLENYRHIPKPEVTELSWESFEQVTITGKEQQG